MERRVKNWTNPSRSARKEVDRGKESVEEEEEKKRTREKHA